MLYFHFLGGDVQVKHSKQQINRSTWGARRLPCGTGLPNQKVLQPGKRQFLYLTFLWVRTHDRIGLKTAQLSSIGDEWRRSVTMRSTGQPCGMTDLTSSHSHTRNKDITVTSYDRPGVSHYRQLTCFFQELLQANAKENVKALCHAPSRIVAAMPAN